MEYKNFLGALALLTASCSQPLPDFEIQREISECQNNSIVLEEGPNTWTLVGDGAPVEWNLRYSSSNELPVKGSDRYRMIRLGNDCYRVRQVNSDVFIRIYPRRTTIPS
jgi:hypothetical protein